MVLLTVYAKETPTRENNKTANANSNRNMEDNQIGKRNV